MIDKFQVIAQGSRAIDKRCRIEQYFGLSPEGLRRALPRDRSKRTFMIAGMRDLSRIDRYGAVYPARVQQGRSREPPSVSHQPIRFLFDHGIAFTAKSLQPWPVKHRDMSALVMYDAEPLQFSRGIRNALTPYTEHVGNQFLGHFQLIRG